MRADAKPWLKNYPEAIQWDYLPEPKPAHEMLSQTAAKFPEHRAINFLGTYVTYAELDRQVGTLATSLMEMGIGKGSHVGILMPNCPQFIVSYYAILKTGATVVNYSPLYSADEIGFQIQDSNTTSIITLNLTLLLPKVMPYLGKELEHIIIDTLPAALPPLKALAFSIFKGKEQTRIPDKPGIYRFSSLTENRGSAGNFPEVSTADTAVIQYTGGTTGTPKGAMLSHANIYLNAEQCSLWCNIDPPGQGITLCALPFFHVFAMTTCMNYGILRGSTLVLVPKFNLKQVLHLIKKTRPTIMPGVPTMFNAIARHIPKNSHLFNSLKACISGGAPLPEAVKQQFESKTHCTLIEGYGLTEASPVIAANPISGKNLAGSIGLPFPQTDIFIEDLENPEKEVEQGERGNLCVSGPQIMQGYYNNAEENKQIFFDVDGKRFMRTGDVAILEDSGYIRIVDRLKELIISGGFNIYPRTIEEALYQIEDITDAAVIGIDDDYLGQVPKAFIVLNESSQLKKEEIFSMLSTKLGKHEQPRHLEIRNSLPKTMIGKIDKKQLL